jgi:hypothetical protein
MIQVVLLTGAQKDELIGQLYEEDSYFNPIQDLNDNWIISVEEIEQCVTPEFMWVKELTLIPYEPKPTPPLNDPAN